MVETTEPEKAHDHGYRSERGAQSTGLIDTGFKPAGVFGI